MKAERLEPCPFCGAPAAIQSQFGREWWAQCTKPECGKSDGRLYASATEAEDEWNRRPAHPQEAALAQPSDDAIDALWTGESLSRPQIVRRRAIARSVLAAFAAQPPQEGRDE